MLYLTPLVIYVQGVRKPDVPLDLQAAVDAFYALAGYERLIAYTQAPPAPVLSLRDAAWVDATLRGARLRV